MKTFLPNLILFFALTILVNTQTYSQEPFRGFRNFDFLKASELVLASATYDEAENQVIFKQTIFDLNEAGELIMANSSVIDNVTGGSRQVDIAKGNFNGDKFDDYVFAYAGDNRTVKIYTPMLDTENFEVTEAFRYTVEGNIAENHDKLKGRIKLVTGDFDGDLLDEFAVMYAVPTFTASWEIYLELFDTDASFDPKHKLSIPLGTTLTDFGNRDMEVFDLVADDLDFNGKDEIVFAWGHDDNGDNTYDISAKVLAFENEEGNYSFETKAERDLNFSNNPGYIKAIFLETGRLYHSVYPSLIALAVTEAEGVDQSDYKESAIKTFIFEDNENTPEYDITESMEESFSESMNLWQTDYYDYNLPNISIATGDIDGNGLEEFFILNSIRLYAFVKSETDFSFTHAWVETFGEIADVSLNCNNGLIISDVNKDIGLELYKFFNDTEWGGTGFSNLEGFEVSVSEVPEYVFDFANPTFYHVNDHPGAFTAGLYKYSLAAGDFDGDRVRLGEPEYHQITEIVQPLVILNAPPIHFDKINGTIYDINGCYNGNDCDFEALYSVQTSQSLTASATIMRDWSITNSHSYGGGFFGLGAKKTIKNTYGKNYSKTNTLNNQYTITQQVSAKTDDYLYATIIDYDIWEFPILSGDSITGYVMDVQPQNIQNAWFQSKSWRAFTYVPNHEVGNILSYADYPAAASNPFAAEEIKFGNFSDTYGLGYDPGPIWSLHISDFGSSAEDHKYTISKEVTREGSFSIFGDFWNFGFGMDSQNNYSQENINTHQIEMMNELEITVQFGDLSTGIGETIYHVGPYAYWSKNGEMYLDYVTRTESGTGTNTWWDNQYGQYQDPAFILPWRLDEEKGFTLEDPLKKYQTKSIQFSNDRPEVGDTITIYAIVHNFSMLPTEDTIKVSFYDGHPNEGGNILSDIHGYTFVTTPTFLQPRGFGVVEFQWVYTEGFEDFQKIFAYIDPDGVMSEIHEDNNIGFNIMGLIGQLPNTVEDVEPYCSELTVYPNPATGYAVVEFTLNKLTKTVVDIYDLNGQLIKTQVDQNLGAGTWQSVIDLADLPNGIYVISLTANREKSNAKLIVCCQ